MKRILPKSWILLIALLCAVNLQAQDRNVSGKVTSADDNTALPGVNVIVKGTTTGTTTNAEGNYNISVPDNATLVFSFIGLLTQEVPVGNRTNIDVRMQTDVQQLSEVVVTGYGTQERKDLTGSITSVEGDKIANLATPSFDQQLAGRAAGVQVTTTNGVLGAAPRIRIRGTNSISSGADPLIVVDGIPVITGDQSGVTTNNPLGDINPNDIESFEVLKDGSATAIYGSRAANGVILITTKRGKEGRAQIAYNGFVGVNNVVSRLDLLNAEQFIEISNEKFSNLTGNEEVIARPGEGNVDTDWQDEIFRTGLVHNHALSISGGSEKTAYFFSLGYMDQEGALVANEMNRATFRANVDHKAKDWLSIGTTLGFTRTQNFGLNTGSAALSGNVTGAAKLLPNVAVLDPNNPTGYNITPDGVALGQGNNEQSIDFNYANIAFALANNKLEATNYRVLGNAFAEATILRGLRLRTQYGVDLLFNEDFLSYDPRHGDGRGSNGNVVNQFRSVLRWNWQNTISYDRTIASNHNIGFVAGVEYQKSIAKDFTAQGTDFSDRFFIQDGLISGTYATQFSDGSYEPTGFDSYFARLNYGFKGKYLLSATVRNDGISSLPLDNRRGTFPGGSVGWRISEEEFFKSAGFLGFVSDFKVRASYAQVGNVDIGAFPYLGTFGPAQYASQNGISFYNTGNPNLQWESSKKTNVGFDLSVLENRIGVTFDYFVNDVDELVLDAPTPFSLGVPNNSISQNIGALRNNGVELRIVSQNINQGGFTWTTDFNFSYIQNEITALNENKDVLFTYNINRVGEPIGALYGFTNAGVNPANGNPLYVKADGTIIQGNIANNTYYVYNPADPNNFSADLQTTLSSSEDRSIIGNSNPTWQGGMTNNLTYKGFDLEIFLRYSGGNKIMNATRQDQLRMDFVNNSTEILNRWTTPGQVTDVPKLEYGNTDFINNTNFASTRFVESGDFLRVQNVVLGYTFPNTFFKGNINRLRVFAQGQNLFTFTGYSGLDPELFNSNTTNSQFGVDFNGSPIMRTITFGVNLSL